jgi:hypothetical protein
LTATLADIRARVREDLQDTDDTNYRWSNDELDGAIERAVQRYSFARPLQQKTDVATVASSHDLDLSSLAGRLKVYSIEFPMGEYPPFLQHFEIYVDTASMEAEGDGENAAVRWGKRHSLQGVTAWEASTAYAAGDIVIPTTGNGRWYECTVAGTSDAAEPTWPATDGGTVEDNTVTWSCSVPTLPVEHEEIIVLGATAYLALSAAAYTADRATISGRWASPAFIRWGAARLDLYHSRLKDLGRTIKEGSFLRSSW